MISELKNGPSAHAPSGTFQANAAWLTSAALAFNVTRACRTLAGIFHARAPCAAIRDRLICVPARPDWRRTHRLPDRRPRQDGFEAVLNTVHPCPRLVDPHSRRGPPG
ncbi:MULTISPECIES: hypothetical protein [unclassified Streptomyces]|uniref:hypothetical protein n=1 Tax=unclassified Streptomyces TaxID=2593676 RepID=UPI003D8A3F9C